MGVGKARKKTKESNAGEQSVLHAQQSGNKFAQLLVEKYQLGPKIQLFLEQAGLRWTPARLVHLCIMAFGVGFVLAWVLLPGSIPHALAFVVGVVFAPSPFVYVWMQRRGPFERNSKAYSRKRWSSSRAPCAPAMRFSVSLRK